MYSKWFCGAHDEALVDGVGQDLSWTDIVLVARKWAECDLSKIANVLHTRRRVEVTAGKKNGLKFLADSRVR